MHPAILAAQAPEFDLGRVVFIIMLLVGGFLQWLVNWWKKKRAEAVRMQQSASTPEELEAREKAWQHQTGAEILVPTPTAAPNPIEELLKTFRELTAPEIAPPPVVLPPLLESRTEPVVEVERAPAPQAAEAPVAPVAIVQQRPRHPITINLAGPGALRQAVVFREILGPPKALQSTDDHLI